MGEAFRTCSGVGSGLPQAALWPARQASFSLRLHRQEGDGEDIVKDTDHCFTTRAADWGFREVLDAMINQAMRHLEADLPPPKTPAAILAAVDAGPRRRERMGGHLQRGEQVQMGPQARSCAVGWPRLELPQHKLRAGHQRLGRLARRRC
mgnify:CR=1 FL=1